VGLVDEERYRKFCERKRGIEKLLKELEGTRITPTAGINDKLRSLGLDPINKAVSLKELLRRPGVSRDIICLFKEGLASYKDDVWEEVEIMVKYEGYIKRQEDEVRKFRDLEKVIIPEEIDYREVHGLSNEIIEKLNRVRPYSLGQASRIPGVTPAAITAIVIHMKKKGWWRG